MGDFTFWISLSLSKRLSGTVNLSPKIRSKTEVWLNSSWDFRWAKGLSADCKHSTTLNTKDAQRHGNNLNASKTHPHAFNWCHVYVIRLFSGTRKWHSAGSEIDVFALTSPTFRSGSWIISIEKSRFDGCGTGSLKDRIAANEAVNFTKIEIAVV